MSQAGTVAGALNLDSQVGGEGGLSASAFLRGHYDCFHENSLSFRMAKHDFMKIAKNWIYVKFFNEIRFLTLLRKCIHIVNMHA